jgi:hypothetical protein
MFYLNIKSISPPFYQMRLYRTSRQLYQVQFENGAAITVTDTGRIVALVYGQSK